MMRRTVVARARERLARRAWLADAEVEHPRAAADGNVAGNRGFHAKLPADHPDYKPVVAEPVMAAVDRLPEAYRALVHRLGYVEVFLHWRRGTRPERIEALAAANGGRLPAP